MAKLERGNHFLSGFGNENFIEEFYMDRTDGPKPSTILSQNDDAYKLEIGVPFLKEEDIKLRLVGNELTISGKKSTAKTELAENKRNYIGVFYLPSDVKTDDISAHFEDGLLTVRLPKNKIDQKIHDIILT
jgi:HSP20 family protein